ncbi:WD40 repeat domain-containing protein [Dechloromonas sp. A34]|uniref:WD40 repeat domain-containing protein n=1 Tax=Dechloromonas sp. A34 TaxID=447588 RepID=UPI002248DD2E|nr:WD40 repeat domain-containing protein [Dechloromonas sp. A34]
MAAIRIFGVNVRTSLLIVALVAISQSLFAADDVVPVLRGHTAWVMAIALSPDETKALSASDSDGIRFWDVPSKKELAHFNAHHVANLYAAFDVKFAPDGAFAVSGGLDKAVEIWNLRELNSERRLVEHPWGVNVVSVSPRGDRILSAGQGGALILWNRATGKSICQLNGHERMYALTTVNFFNDGKNAISASQDQSIRTWDLSTCKQLSIIQGKAYKGGPLAMAISNNLAVSYGIDRKTLLVWELSTGLELRRMTGHTMDIRAIRISPDGKQVVSGGQDKRLLTWDVGTGKLIKEQPVPTEIVSLEVSRTGTSVFVGGKDGTIYRASLK